MKFLLDENFPKAAHAFLRALGHTTTDLRGTPSEGSEDHEVFQIARNDGAILLTTDRDFFHTIPTSNPNHEGIIVIALKQPNRSAIIGRLEWILSHVPPEVFCGRVFQLRDHTWLAYPPIE